MVWIDIAFISLSWVVTQPQNLSYFESCFQGIWKSFKMQKNSQSVFYHLYCILKVVLCAVYICGNDGTRIVIGKNHKIAFNLYLLLPSWDESASALPRKLLQKYSQSWRKIFSKLARCGRQFTHLGSAESHKQQLSTTCWEMEDKIGLSFELFTNNFFLNWGKSSKRGIYSIQSACENIGPTFSLIQTQTQLMK